MKKTTVLLVSAALITFITGCGSSKSNTDAEPAINTSGVLEDNTVEIVEPVASETESIPVEALAFLDSLPYYGNRSKCRMTTGMAAAYADTLDDIPAVTQIFDSAAKLHASLIDLADDGHPFLVTTYWRSGDWGTMGMLHHFYGYSDGRVVTDTFPGDAHFGVTPGYYYLCDIEGTQGLMVKEPGAQNIGSAPEWDIFYVSDNGRLMKKYEVGAYSAYLKDNGTTGCGTDIPGIGTFSNAEKTDAPVEEFERAGWLCPSDYSNAFGLWYFTLNGEKLDVSQIPYSDYPLSDVLRTVNIDIFNYEKCVYDDYSGLNSWVPHQEAEEVAGILKQYAG